MADITFLTAGSFWLPGHVIKNMSCSQKCNLCHSKCNIHHGECKMLKSWLKPKVKDIDYKCRALKTYSQSSPIKKTSCSPLQKKRTIKPRDQWNWLTLGLYLLRFDSRKRNCPSHPPHLDKVRDYRAAINEITAQLPILVFCLLQRLLCEVHFVSHVYTLFRFIYTEWKRRRKRNIFLWSKSLLNVNIKLDSLWTHLETMSPSLSLSDNVNEL